MLGDGLEKKEKDEKEGGAGSAVEVCRALRSIGNCAQSPHNDDTKKSFQFGDSYVFTTFRSIMVVDP